MKVNVAEELNTIRETATIPIAVVQEQDELLAQVGRDARDILGYKPLHKLAVLKECRLRETLIELGIEVLNPATILLYQEKLGVPHPDLRELVKNSGAFVEAVDDDDESDEDDDDEMPSNRKSWQRQSLESYGAPIPAHVLQKAIEIKKALPSVEFSVEQLKMMPDPFLIVEFREEQFYIEVWEEPKFEGRVTVDNKKKIK
jgi:hypothetical protein